LTPHNSACYNLKSTLGGDIIYAIVEAGGKQYRVAPKQTIQVDRLDTSTGKTVELDRVLLIGDGQDTLVGTPTIEGAKVVASSMGEVKGDKLTVFKYKNKTRYRKKTGHRPIYTRLSIEEVVRPEA
jgi:large subunit ribosomal protein L21